MFLSLYPCLFERVWQLFLQSSPELSRHHQQALCKDMNGVWWVVVSCWRKCKGVR